MGRRFVLAVVVVAVGALGLTRCISLNNPAITQPLNPSSGPADGGTVVDIIGSQFTCGSDTPLPNTTVTFGGIAATAMTVNSDTEIHATSPGGLGRVYVKVSTPLCGDSNAVPFDYQTTVTVDATTTTGPALLRAQGFLGEVPTQANQSQVSALHPQQWRVADPAPDPPGGPAADQHDYNGARSYPGVKITEILSNYWGTGHAGHASWEDWSVYDAFVNRTVKGLLAAGDQVDYWDVENEPGNANPAYSPPENASLGNDYSHEFLHAYNDIRQAYGELGRDPETAKIIGPSIPEFQDVPNQNMGNGAIDLDTFMSFAQDNNLKFAGISWHELDQFQGAAQNRAFPGNVADHVGRARNLMQKYPLFAHAQIIINEYGASRPNDGIDNWLVPGWSVGWLGAFEDVNVDQANRTCWDATNGIPCQSSDVDGLFTDTGHTQPNYWVHERYAEFSRLADGTSPSTRVRTETTDSTATAFATRDDGAQDVKILLGRHNAKSGPGVPADTTLTVLLPFAANTVSIGGVHIPNQGAGPTALDQPEPVTLCAACPVVNGTVTLTISAMADGDAYAITVHKAT